MVADRIASNIFKQWVADIYCATCGNRMTHVEMKALVKKHTTSAKQLISFAKARLKGKKVQPCICCDRIQPIQGRGLCGACIARYKKAGTLNELYPKRKKAA